MGQAQDLLTSWGVGSWQEVTSDHVRNLQIAFGQEVSPSTLRRRLSALRSLLKFLRKIGRGADGDLPTASGIKLPKRLPKALSEQEIEVLMASPDLASPLGIRDRCLMELIFGAGLRISEVCQLGVADAVASTGLLRILGKRGKVRVVPLPGQTSEWVEIYLRDSRPKLVKKASSHLFLGARGGPLSRQSAFLILDSHREQAGLPGPLSPHTLRHTYAVTLLTGGADLRVVQELLGHSSIDTTQVYTQLDLEKVRVSYRKAHPRK